MLTSHNGFDIGDGKIDTEWALIIKARVPILELDLFLHFTHHHSEYKMLSIDVIMILTFGCTFHFLIRHIAPPTPTP